MLAFHKCIVRASCFAVALASSAAVASAQSNTWTPRKVEKLRSVTAALLSPDGAHVAYGLSVPRIAGTDEDGAAWTELHVIDTADTSGGHDRPFITGKINVGAFAWTPDGAAIAFLCKRDGDKQTALYEIAVAGGEAQKKIELDGTSIGAFSFAPDGKRVALVATAPDDAARKKLVDKGFKQIVYEEDAPSSKLWIASLDDAQAKPRMLGIEGSIHQVQWSPTDDRIAISVTPTPLVDDEYMRQRVRVVDATDGRVLMRIENPGKLGPIAWSPDGAWIASMSAQDLHDPAAGRLIVWNSGLDSKRPISIAAMPDGVEVDVGAFGFQDADTLMMCVHHGAETTFEKVKFWGVANLEYKTIVSPGVAIFGSLSLSKDGQHAAFVANRFDHPPEVYTMSHGDAAPKRCTNSNPWTKDLRLAKQELVTWKARDGLELEGILVRPLDEEKGKRYPLCLCVHGGPESHDSNGWTTGYSRPGQMAAAHGIAVLYPNYRASTGRGVAFSKLDQGDAAGKEFDDLVDAVDHLIETGLVDKDKVGVTGGSYGGYATGWLSTKYSERFAAGVMFVGISDMPAMLDSTDIPEEHFLVHALKRPWEEEALFRDRSPIAHADHCRTPLLILGGKDDPRVDPSQSKELYRCLKLRGHAPVRLVQYPGEGHGNRKSCARFDYSVRMMEWLEHYLTGPGGEPPAWDVRYDETAKEKSPVAGG